jgi:2-polyprenyl-3-methyl-5-hydroxy-6-metoxy-1,4-benzoquinol methylase
MYRKKIYERYLTSDNFRDFNEIENQFNSINYIDQNIIDVLPNDKKAKILDIGCGFGKWLKYLKENGYIDVNGVEIGEEQNQFLKDKGFNVIKSDIVDFLKTTNHKYSLITMFDVLEHFRKDEIVELIPLLKNILSDNGILIVRVPNGEAMYKGGIMYGDFTHETFFSARSLKQVFRLYDFGEIDVFPVYPIKHSFKSTIRYYGYKFYEFFYKVGIIFEMGQASDFISSQNILGIIRK